MPLILSRESEKSLSLQRLHQYVLTFLIGSLSVTVLLKVGEIQYLELVLAADFLFVIVLLLNSGGVIRIFRPYLSIASSYAIFLGLAFLLSLIALHQDFFLFNDNVFKKPLLLTVARMAELFLDVFYMLYLASLYREDQKLCKFGARTYYWVGIAGCIYAIATYPLNVLFEMELGTYGDSHRLRGFNNEAGSFGTYLISVCVLAIAMRRRDWLSRRQFYWGITLLIVCLIGSQSKAGFLMVATLGLINVMWALNGFRRWLAVVLLCALFTVLAVVIDLPGKIDIYVQGSASYQKLSLLKDNDANVVMGRISGAVLAPRMIAAHPWLGIGWGNYPLVRDDPQYRRGTAFSMGSLDSPSLGPIDYIVELGFPLWLYMTWLSLKPVYLLRRNGDNVLLLSMAMMQPLANWFGAHLNITYPWVVVGLALGMGFRKEDEVIPIGRLDLPRQSL